MKIVFNFIENCGKIVSRGLLRMMGHKIYLRARSLITYLRLYLGLKGNKASELKLELLSGGGALGESDAIRHLMGGKVLVVRGFLQRHGYDAMLSQAIGVDLQELPDLHKNRTLQEITNLVTSKRSSFQILNIQSKVIVDFAKSLGLEDIYIEMEPNLRLQPPFETVKAQVKEVEAQIGSGQVSPHSAHKDSWYYHPRNTLNIWIPVTDCDRSNSLSILEGSQDYYPRSNDFELEDYASARSSEHVELDLKKGDAVIFLAELLHGSIINQSQITRGTLSVRFSLGAPESHAGRRYKYMKFSLKSKNLRPYFQKSGRFSHLKNEKDYKRPELQEGVTVSANKITLSQAETELSFPRYCPHKGVDMAGGFYCPTRKGWICPSHRLCVASINQSYE